MSIGQIKTIQANTSIPVNGLTSPSMNGITTANMGQGTHPSGTENSQNGWNGLLEDKKDQGSYHPEDNSSRPPEYVPRKEVEPEPQFPIFTPRAFKQRGFKS